MLEDGTIIVPAWGEEDEERLKLIRLMETHEQMMNSLYQAELWVRRPYREIRDHLTSLLRQELEKLKEHSYAEFVPAVKLGDIPANPHPVEPLPSEDIKVLSGLKVQVSGDKITVTDGRIRVRNQEIEVRGTVLDRPLPPFKVVVTGSGEVVAASEAAGLVYTLLEVDG